MTGPTDRMPGRDPEPRRFDSRGASRSNFLAFVIGGLSLALGSAAFMYHDGRQSARDLVAIAPLDSQAGERSAGRGYGLLQAPAARP